MKLVKKSVTLTQQQDDWIKSQVSKGLYANDSEVLRDLIRREQERRDGLEALRQALVEGERSGVSPYTPEQILEQARARIRKIDDV
ncbi:MAG: antitoxin ParD1/3/4 [Myxococcota bacterium]|jgi:antitoxin ParD1/3/4